MYSKDIPKWVDATLHNDEVSSDEDLIEYFVESGLIRCDAEKVVSQRTRCLNDLHYRVVL